MQSRSHLCRKKVIHYIEQNGYVESKAVLMKPPFDQPILFTRLFDGKTGSELMDTINQFGERECHPCDRIKW